MANYPIKTVTCILTFIRSEGILKRSFQWLIHKRQGLYWKPAGINARIFS